MMYQYNTTAAFQKGGKVKCSACSISVDRCLVDMCGRALVAALDVILPLAESSQGGRLLEGICDASFTPHALLLLRGLLGLGTPAQGHCNNTEMLGFDPSRVYTTEASSAISSRFLLGFTVRPVVCFFSHTSGIQAHTGEECECDQKG